MQSPTRSLTTVRTLKRKRKERHTQANTQTVLHYLKQNTNKYSLTTQHQEQHHQRQDIHNKQTQTNTSHSNTKTTKQNKTQFNETKRITLTKKNTENET